MECVGWSLYGEEGRETRPGEGGKLQVKMVAGKMRGAAWPWKLVSYLVVGDVVVVSLLSPPRPHLPGREGKGGREGTGGWVGWGQADR